MLGEVGSAGNIKFVCVARLVPDRTMVACHVSQHADDTMESYVRAVEEVINTPNFLNKVESGVRYRLTGDLNALNFLVDKESRVYVVIAVKNYERHVFLMLHDLIRQFNQDYAGTSLTCAPNGLSGKCRKLFQRMLEAYDDPTKNDKLSEVVGLVNKTKQKMGENIDILLDDMERLKDIEKSTEVLVDQSSKFNRNATTLKKRELCKQYQTTACIAVALLVLLIVILLATVGPGVPSPTQTPRPTIAPSAAGRV